MNARLNNFVVTMADNFFPMNFLLFFVGEGLFNNIVVLVLLNKMGSLNASTVTSLRLLVRFDSMPLCLYDFGETVFLPLHISLTTCPLNFYMGNPLKKFFTKNILIIPIYVFLVVSVTQPSFPTQISLIVVLVVVFLLAILLVKKDTAFLMSSLIEFLSAEMLYSMRRNFPWLRKL